MPTCLDKDPEQTGTVRGCFCPEGQFLQDGECVKADGCKCLYEGQFYDVSVNTRKYYFFGFKSLGWNWEHGKGWAWVDQPANFCQSGYFS